MQCYLIQFRRCIVYICKVEYLDTSMHILLLACAPYMSAASQHTVRRTQLLQAPKKRIEHEFHYVSIQQATLPA